MSLQQLGLRLWHTGSIPGPGKRAAGAAKKNNDGNEMKNKCYPFIRTLHSHIFLQVTKHFSENETDSNTKWKQKQKIVFTPSLCAMRVNFQICRVKTKLFCMTPTSGQGTEQ